MNINKVFLIFAYSLCFFIILAAPAIAQSNIADDDKVQSLGDILNPQSDDGVSSVKNAKEMANIYYKKCIKEKSLAFDEEEKEILCACTSAEIGSVISTKEFKNLYKDNYKGKDARGKVLAYAYTKCMDYVIENKLFNDCMVSPTIKKIVTGKSAVCNCSTKSYKDIIAKDTSYIIMEAIKYDPMTLNPLEHYFTSTNYEYMFDKHTQYCYSRMLYNKHNKR